MVNKRQYEHFKSIRLSSLNLRRYRRNLLQVKLERLKFGTLDNETSS